MTGWPAVVMAISLSILALAGVVHVFAYIRYLSELQSLSRRFDDILNTLDRDARPALQSLRTAAEDGGRVFTLVRKEAEAFSDGARSLREGVQDVAERLEERFREFETLADLLQDELEDTALDVAAALRTTRRGTGLFRKMKRAFLKGR